MAIKYRVRYKNAFCSKCDKEVEFCYREVREFEAGEREPLSVAFDRVLHHGGCDIDASATPAIPSHEEMLECPVYLEILSSVN
jgi:hypothetical protein